MKAPLAPDRLVPPTPGQLRRLMGAERLRPRQSLSQTFLTDPVALDAIVEAAELEAGDNVVEIGPGLGVLTRRLLAAGASVLAVEVDPRLAEYLRRELYGVDRFELIEADALSLHPREMFQGEPSMQVDRRLAEYLPRELYGVDRFELVEANTLFLRPREMFPDEPFKVVANSPYHITSALLHTFLEGDRPPDTAVLLVQLEVAERVA